MLDQISVFAENTKGAMFRITSILADAGISMNALITNDSAEFGIVRMIVEDGQKAKELYQKAGYLCHCDRVFAVRIGDGSGSLNHLLKDVADAGINIDYLYMSYDRGTAEPIVILKTSVLDEVDEVLRWKGYTVL